MFDVQKFDASRAALLIMHYQVDVFSLLSGIIPGDIVHRANSVITSWRRTGRPIVFANFALGANYEYVHENNRLLRNIMKTGRFRQPSPVDGLDTRDEDRRYTCPRASVFQNTSLGEDLRCEGIDTLVMAGIASSGVLFSTIGAASDMDYQIQIIRACCYDPDEHAHDALFRTSFATRAAII